MMAMFRMLLTLVFIVYDVARPSKPCVGGVNAGDNQSVDKVPGRKTSFHCLKRPEEFNEFGTMAESQTPKVFVFNDIQAYIPCFSTVFTDIFEARNS